MSDRPENAESATQKQGDDASHSDALENRYYAYLRAQGYSSESALVDVLRGYLPHFTGRRVVADLGCGHGEFLTLLREAGHEAVGVDIDPAMVEHCRALGFDVALGDAVAWLEAHPGEFGGVFSSNVIEHLSAVDAQRWIAASFTALEPGGVLLFATPNPESAIVQLHEFWRDATHVRMYSRQLLEFLLVDAGFTAVQSGMSEAARWDGNDRLLEAIREPLPELPLPPEVGEILPPPAPPTEGASWKEQMTWKVTSEVYTKFVEGWVDSMRSTLQSHANQLAAQRQALLATQTQFAAIYERLQWLAGAQNFLYPSREIFVVGRKPGGA